MSECAWVLHLIGWFIALSLGTIFGYVLCALLTHDADDDDDDDNNNNNK